ncbi:MAG TPA: hypothetical protein VJ796_10285 [Acidimicrobiia bacterium]|nr:hypothetical protein [Acidimicrobiia bacterium]
MTLPRAMANPNTPTAAARTRSISHISRIRSTRSTTTPAGRPKRSHGNVAAAVIPATACGDEEMEAAMRGNAAITTPSPRLEMVDAARRRRKPLVDRIRLIVGNRGGTVL